MALRATDLLGVTDGAGSGSVESSPFTALPFELVAHIITAAARDCVLTSTRWVASLTLVCRAIHTAVDPILVKTLRVTDTNLEAVARSLTRFQQTQHMNIVSLGCNEMKTPLEALFWHHCSSLKAVTFVHTGAMLFSHHVLIMLRDRNKGNFDPVPYLHIRRCWLSSERPHLGVKGVPASITHLALDPVIRGHGTSDLLRFIHFLPFYLEGFSHGLQRLLLRTACVSADGKAVFIDAVTDIACERRDTRVWIDDDRTSTGEEYVARNEAGLDEDLGIALWYAGHQVYLPS